MRITIKQWLKPKNGHRQFSHPLPRYRPFTAPGVGKTAVINEFPTPKHWIDIITHLQDARAQAVREAGLELPDITMALEKLLAAIQMVSAARGL